MVVKIYRTYPPRRRTRLVEDLVPLIVDLGHPWSIFDLTRMVRVSPAWLFPIQSLLYASITLKHLTHWPLLFRTLQSRPDLSRLVQRISFDEPAAHKIASEYSLKHAFDDMQRIFAHLPELVSLRVGGIGPYARSSVLAAMEALPHPDLLKELEIIRPDEAKALVPRMADKTLTWTEHTPLHGLTVLKISGINLSFRLPIAIRGLPPNLTHLYMNDATIPNLISLQRHPPLKSLIVITKATRYQDPYSQVKYLVPAARETLEHLSHTVIHEVEGPFALYRWEFPVCPKLKTLETDELAYSADWFPRFNLEDRMPALEEWTVWRKREDEEDD